MINILIAEDSPTVTLILKKIFNLDAGLNVVGTARNGREAIEKTLELRPHIITMDINMPVMDGLQATKAIVERCPTPILVISSAVGNKEANTTFEAIRAGALDVIEKPKGNLSMDYEKMGKELIRKVNLLSGIKVFHRISNPNLVRARKEVTQPRPASTGITEETAATVVQAGGDGVDQAAIRDRKVLTPGSAVEIVAIASSTGGPTALLKVLKKLPSDFNAAVIIVQHICEGFGQGLINWLDKECALRVKGSEKGEPVMPGTVYVAADGAHTLIEKDFTLRLTKLLPINGLRPNATLMMESVAEAYGAAALGVILTGMGRDGAEGMKKIKDSGGVTIAQDEASCVVFGMPKEAIGLNAVDRVLPIDEIGDELNRLVSPNGS